MTTTLAVIHCPLCQQLPRFGHQIDKDHRNQIVEVRYYVQCHQENHELVTTSSTGYAEAAQLWNRLR